ncbi:MAG TPA: choice-of-anchor D domain-containing protein [Candidatus Eisenbacteria bacterium]|nr:choice-of-anchor D domain-containing protein [Candidatus Eisenbacteria bacterium]
MPPTRCSPRLPAALAAFAALAVFAPPARALRIVDYNVLNYPGSSGPARDPRYRTILQPLAADVIVTEEQTSQAGVNEFLSQVLNTLEPGQWAAAPFVDGNDTDAALFYKPARVQFLHQRAYYPNAADLLRLVHEYTLAPVGYDSTRTRLVLAAVHLKASTGFESQRGQECRGLRDSLNALPPGTCAFACGDMNFYVATTEPGYTILTESEVDNVGRLYDVFPPAVGAWHDNAASVPIHTQSPCLSGGALCASGASTGGLDDRFDFFLPTLNLGDGQGMDIVPNSYVSVGNDGQHWNKNITDLPITPEGADYDTALIKASDHLPIRIDLQLPSKMALDSSAVALGACIVGAASPPAHALTVQNPAVPPADGLDLTPTAPAGFQALPPGAIAPGLSGTVQITLDASSVGAKSGSLALASDAPDLPLVHVPLSGTVLDHAQASLDSVAAVTAAGVDFGAHDPGEFDPQLVAVFDRDWNALRARLEVAGAAITGGDGRFAIQGFAPTLVSSPGARWSVTFDATQATSDSTYTAELAFTSADEALPGAAPQPDLRVTLSAHVNGAPVAVGAELPGVTRLYAPEPNPLIASSTVRFDLARASHVRLEVFDLSGRRVTSLANRGFAPGRFRVEWNGRDGAGATVQPGLYFVRMTTAAGTQGARLAVVR